MVLLPHWVRRAREHGQLHLGHQRVIDSGVRQPGSIRGPPVGEMGVENFLWNSKTAEGGHFTGFTCVSSCIFKVTRQPGLPK